MLTAVLCKNPTYGLSYFIISAYFLCDKTFSKYTAKTDIIDEIVLNVKNLDSVIKFENSINSEKQVVIFESSLSNILYPFVNDYSLSQPYEYIRTTSNFHIKPICNYYFDEETNDLKYFEVKWDRLSNFDFLKLEKYSDFIDTLIEEKKFINNYKKIYKSINSIISSNYGKATKVDSLIDYSPEKCNGIKSQWINQSYTIETSLIYPKENEIEKVFILYVIYWK